MDARRHIAAGRKWIHSHDPETSQELVKGEVTVNTPKDPEYIFLLLCRMFGLKGDLNDVTAVLWTIAQALAEMSDDDRRGTKIYEALNRFSEGTTDEEQEPHVIGLAQEFRKLIQ